MQLRRLGRLLVVGIPAFLFAVPASAHHLMGGRTPSTFMEGLLSGLGHPVIGPDHLAFLVAVGVAVGVGGSSLALPLVFIVAMVAGVALHVHAFTLPAAEIFVALSVMLVGFLIARGRKLPIAAWAILFALAGLFHGYAFGESIFGAERSPLAAYLLGLATVQGGLTVAVALVARRMQSGISALAPRLAGAAVLGVGFAVLVNQLIPGG